MDHGRNMNTNKVKNTMQIGKDMEALLPSPFLCMLTKAQISLQMHDFNLNTNNARNTKTNTKRKLVGSRRFLLPFFKSARQPSTQYALSLSLMMVAAKYDNIKEILTRIILQIQIMLQMEIQNESTLSLSPMSEAKVQRRSKNYIFIWLRFCIAFAW